MVQLQKELETLEANGIQVAAVSYDKVKVLESFAKKRNITFPLLSDEGSKTITAYGLLNTQANRGFLKGIPYPGTVIIDQSGVIQGKLFYDGYRERHTPADLIKAATD